MKRYARLSTAVIFSIMTLFFTAAPFLLQKLPNSILLLTQLPPALVFKALWSPVLVAALLGAAFGGLFSKITSLRLGVLYAAGIGALLWFPISFAGTLERSELADFIFTLTVTTFDEPSATVPVGIYVLSESSAAVNALSIWLLGPLTGVLVWAWLQVSR